MRPSLLEEVEVEVLQEGLFINLQRLEVLLEELFGVCPCSGYSAAAGSHFQHLPPAMHSHREAADYITICRIPYIMLFMAR